MSNSYLTGLRSNSHLTLGNYLGAIKPMVKILDSLDNQDKFFLFLPDLHSFVTPIDHSKLYQQTLDNLKIYLAAGVDSKKENVYLYRQSFVSAHSELTWILSCFTYFGEANKMIQFKEKSKGQGQNVNIGLFTYPILMAADILLYNAKYVPVGEDQRQHLELTRDLAKRFNNKFGKTFVVPEVWEKQLAVNQLKTGLRIKSLTDPTKKMSKSSAEAKSYILLEDDIKLSVKKIMSATTDNLASVNWDWEKQPGITNLLQILQHLQGVSQEEVKKDWIGNKRYGDLKKAVATELEKFLTAFQAKLAKITDQEATEVLQTGEEKASKIANQTLIRAQKAVGLRQNLD